MSIRRLGLGGFVMVLLVVLLGVLALPALAVAPEAPEVKPVSGAAATTATLNGVLNPKALVAGEGGTYEFLYNVSKTKECKGGFKAPEPAGTSTGSPEEPVSQPVEGLIADTEYAVCLRVENPATHEEAVSPTVTFKTSLPPETPLTEAATVVTGTTATLNGVLNPGKAGEAGTYEFTYQPSKTKECAVGSVAPEQPGVALGNAKEAVSTPVTGLEGSTEYAFCVVAINKAEPAESATGSPLTFKTPASQPVISVESVSGVTPFDGVLEGQVNAEKQETSYRYEYSSEKAKVEGGEGTPIGAGSLPGTSEVQTANPVDIGGGLTPGVTYYYRVVATNGTGTADGKVESFMASAFVAPVVEAEFPTAVGQSTASLSGIVNPEFQSVLKCEFVYAAGGAPLSEPCVPGAAELGEGSGGVVTSVSLTGLTPNTEYHYKVVTENKVGVGEGSEEAFTTLPVLPVVDTGGASTVTTDSASIAGTVNPANSGHSEQDEARYYFQYGQDTSYGKRTSPTPETIGEGTTPVEEQATLGGLAPGRIYHYRIVASNDNNGTAQFAYGQDEQFTTAPAPPRPGKGEQTPETSSAPIANAPASSAFPDLTGVLPIPPLKEPAAKGIKVKPLTQAQKLTKALKACKNKAKGAKRTHCEQQARARYRKSTKKKAVGSRRKTTGLSKRNLSLWGNPSPGAKFSTKGNYAAGAVMG